VSESAALELVSVGKTYGRFAKKPALRSVSLRIPRGECFGLAGANGAGKTTLIRIMLGLLEPDEGDAFLLGERPVDAEVRRRVGFVPEAAMLPESASPRALVRRFARLRGLPANSSMQEGLANLDQLGMGALLDRASGKLSKGERQRTLLALAMLGSPELLILDEPTDGLDPLGRAKMREVIRDRCAAGTTVFLNSHLLGETESLCDRVGILHRGQLVRLIPIGAPGKARGALGPARSQILLANGSELAVAHQSPEELNLEIDRLRQEGQLIVGLRPQKLDLEQTLAQVAGDLAPVPTVTEAVTHLAPDDSRAPAPPARLRPLRALAATGRVAQEIAADLASRKVGWFALGAALLAAVAFFAGIRSELMQGAASLAHQFGAGGLTDPQSVGKYIGAFVARAFFWCELVGGVALSAVFAPSLLEPRRTILLYSQPITRGDYALGVWAATCGLALATSVFFFGLAFAGLRWLEIQAPWQILLAPLPWVLAFGAVLALQLIAVYLVRNGFFCGAVGLGLLFATAVLGAETGLDSLRSRHKIWGLFYALLPRSMDLMEASARLGQGLRPLALTVLPTLGLLCAFLLILRTLALRSES
jgi:ABC-2 type transport system ATP-binding protein